MNAGVTVDDESAVDAALVARMRTGDERALAALYDRHAPALLGLVMRIVRERSEAEAVLMEAFLQAWRTASLFERDRGTVLGWLTTMARSRAIDQVRARARRERREPVVADPTGALQLVDTSRSADPSEHVESEDTRDSVAAALRTLQPAQRAAIELAFFEGLTHVEVAERLAQPIGTIKTRIRMGMLTLRELLAPLGREERA